MKKNYAILIFMFCIQLLQAQSDSSIVEEHLKAIIETKEPRNYKNIKILNQVSDYIHVEFSKYAEEVSFQNFEVNGNTYKNVISVFGKENKETIVIGAHYDVCGNQDGADDNASGVAGLLELSRLLENQKLKYRIELVAYTLEEPPFFRTKNMGSYIHAKKLKEENINVYGMICLEMIGYFKDSENSQSYPLPQMTQLYGNTADFITVVGKDTPSLFKKKFAENFTQQDFIKAYSIFAPESMEGIDFSDHLNYWGFGFDAIMITDTAFFRNKNYHEDTDTIDTLDPKKIVEVINAVYYSLIQL